MKKLLLALPLALTLGVLGFAFAPASAAKSSKNCCCVESDAQLVCALTAATLDQCCCE